MRRALACKALVELCCDADSNLSRLGSEQFGLETLRITEEVRFDSARGLKTALDFIGDRAQVDAWAALPCTAWCTWSYINEAKLGKAYVSRLAYRRRRSIHMVGHAEQCIAAAISGSGAGHFEWTRRARGWQRPRVQLLLSRQKMLLADFDGCSFGVQAAPGILALKPWRLATTRGAVA